MGRPHSRDAKGFGHLSAVGIFLAGHDRISGLSLYDAGGNRPGNRQRLLEAEDPEAVARLDAAFGGSEPKSRLPGPVEFAIGWFPADQWAAACQRWPNLLDDLPADHIAYSQVTEIRTKRIARHAPGSRLHVAWKRLER